MQRKENDTNWSAVCSWVMLYISTASNWKDRSNPFYFALCLIFLLFLLSLNTRKTSSRDTSLPSTAKPSHSLFLPLKKQETCWSMSFFWTPTISPYPSFFRLCATNSPNIEQNNLHSNTHSIGNLADRDQQGFLKDNTYLEKCTRSVLAIGACAQGKRRVR